MVTEEKEPGCIHFLSPILFSLIRERSAEPGGVSGCIEAISTLHDESNAFDQLMETDPQGLQGGVGDPTGLCMPVMTAAIVVATRAPPWAAHAVKTLMSGTAPLHCISVDI